MDRSEHLAEERRGAKLRSAMVGALIVFGVALTIRLVGMYCLSQSIFWDVSLRTGTDVASFDEQAQKILKGDYLLGKQAFHQSPFYTYFLAAVYAVAGHNYAAPLLIQSVCGSLVALMLFLIGRDLIGEIGGWVAGTLGALYQMFIFYDLILLRSSLLVFFSTGILFLAVLSKRRRGKVFWFLCGTVCGVAFLIKPTTVFFPMVLFFSMYFWSCLRGRTLVTACLLLTAGLIVAISPLIARNLIVGVSPLDMGAIARRTFVGANVAEASGYSWDTSYEADRILEESRGSFIELAQRTLATHPDISSVFHLQLRKIKALFNAYEFPNNVSVYVYREEIPFFRLPFFSYRLVAAMGAVGLLLALLRGLAWVPVYVHFVCWIAVTLPFYILSRFRQPLVPILILLAALAVSELTGMVRRKWWPGTALVVGATVILVWLNAPMQSCLLRGVDVYEWARIHGHIGNYDRSAEILNQGTDDFARAAEERPDDYEPVLKQYHLLALTDKVGLIEIPAETFRELETQILQRDPPRFVRHWLESIGQ